MPLRAAVIGCGRIGSMAADDPKLKAVYSHAQGYSLCPATELVAVCDSDERRAEECARRWGLQSGFTSVEETLEKARPDIVSVCTPDETHAAILGAVLRDQGVRGILAEKPLALSVAEAEEIAGRAEANGVALAVNYTRRFSDRHARMRERVSERLIGEIQTISGYYTKGILHNATHWIDLARWFAGDIESVAGLSSEPFGERDRMVDARFIFKSGARGVLQGCRDDAFTIFDMDIVGTRGRVRLADFGLRHEVFLVRDDPNYSGYRSLGRESDELAAPEDTLLRAVEDLAQAVNTGSRPRCTGRDGVEAIRAAYAAIESAATGKAVRC